MGLGIPRVVSTLDAIEFRRGVTLTVSFLRQSQLDAVVKGYNLSVKLEGNKIIRSDGKAFSLPKGLKIIPSLGDKDFTLVVFYSNGRSNSQKFFIRNVHGRTVTISIDPLSSIPECKYY